MGAAPQKAPSQPRKRVAFAAYKELRAKAGRPLVPEVAPTAPTSTSSPAPTTGATLPRPRIARPGSNSVGSGSDPVNGAPANGSFTLGDFGDFDDTILVQHDTPLVGSAADSNDAPPLGTKADAKSGFYGVCNVVHDFGNSGLIKHEHAPLAAPECIRPWKPSSGIASTQESAVAATGDKWKAQIEHLRRPSGKELADKLIEEAEAKRNYVPNPGRWRDSRWTKRSKGDIPEWNYKVCDKPPSHWNQKDPALYNEKQYWSLDPLALRTEVNSRNINVVWQSSRKEGIQALLNLDKTEHERYVRKRQEETRKREARELEEARRRKAFGLEESRRRQARELEETRKREEMAHEREEARKREKARVRTAASTKGKEHQPTVKPLQRDQQAPSRVTKRSKVAVTERREPTQAPRREVKRLTAKTTTAKFVKLKSDGAPKVLKKSASDKAIPGYLVPTQASLAKSATTGMTSITFKTTTSKPNTKGTADIQPRKASETPVESDKDVKLANVENIPQSSTDPDSGYGGSPPGNEATEPKRISRRANKKGPQISQGTASNVIHVLPEATKTTRGKRKRSQLVEECDDDEPKARKTRKTGESRGVKKAPSVFKPNARKRKSDEDNADVEPTTHKRQRRARTPEGKEDVDDFLASESEEEVYRAPKRKINRAAYKKLIIG